MPSPNPCEALLQMGLRPPKTLTIAVTGVCNLRCSHCWVSAGASTAVAPLPVRTLQRMIDQFAAMGGRAIRITGGEPLCYPGWLDVVRHALKKGIEGISLQTNGMLLTDGDAAALRELECADLSIQISLDGASASTHDQVRGVGSFAAALAGIQRLVQAGLADRITIFFTEMQHNLADIPALMEMAAALGIASVVSGTLVQCGRAGENSDVAPPEPEQYEQLLQRYADDGHFRELYQRIGTVAAIEWSRSQAVREECCTFAENPYLTADGRLYPCLLCHTDDFMVSGVFEKGLERAFVEAAPIWAELMRISRCRPDEISGCRDCPGRQVCAGGCMGRAWGSHGDLMAADDRCHLRRSIYASKA